MPFPQGWALRRRRLLSLLAKLNPGSTDWRVHVSTELPVEYAHNPTPS